MGADLKLCLIAAAVLIALNILIICRLIVNKLGSNLINKIKQLKPPITKALFNTTMLGSNISFTDFLKLKHVIELDELQQNDLVSTIDINKFEAKNIKHLRSHFKYYRIEAAVHLGSLATENARAALESTILNEKDPSVKLFVANALSDIGNPKSLEIMVCSLFNSKRWYRNKVNELISDFGEAFNSFIPNIIESDKIEIKELIVDFAEHYFSPNLKLYLISLLNQSVTAKNKDLSASINELVNRAANILAKYYPQILDDDKYLNSRNTDIKNIAIGALANHMPLENLTRLVSYFNDPDSARIAVNTMAVIIEQYPECITNVVDMFNTEPDIEIKQRLAEVLAGKMEYFIMRLTRKNSQPAVDIIKRILLQGRTSEFIDFLNKNRDIEIENELLAIAKDVIPVSSYLEKQFSIYLNERIANKCGLYYIQEPNPKKDEQKDKKLIQMLYALLISTVLIFPIIYLIRHYNIMFKLSVLEQIKIFVIDFNYYLAYYSIAINLIYIILLMLSYIKVKQQYKQWNIKNIPFLFKKKMLPAISIIAPAFNEEKTIIESVNSLLNLKYPDYDLIIVNDGSKDSTLNVLIKYFDLTRIDYIVNTQLKTKPVRGIYMNRSIPKLIVADKENGGKADSLNAGINISKKEYFCGIDADSLLENEALLKLASLTLNEGIETPALGGNIFPINGCRVERGQIKNINIPQNSWARFQTVEYIRAFMAGRLGWAAVNSLLIISGAFGLFRRERIIETGGYLTSSGKYSKDTVGEDMELVVRISRIMRELKCRYRVCYAYNANCWTEVPEDLKSLKKQRYRWHRGLIDILSFHKKMIFNPRYGRTGLIAMPYFLIFEMVGPIIEFQGYIMVLLAYLLGLLNVEIAALLFVTIILMGVLISISALLIAESDIQYFSLSEIVVLIIYAVIENFGPRQLFSMWRVGGYINTLKKPSEWGKLTRKGFTEPSDSTIHTANM